MEVCCLPTGCMRAQSLEKPNLYIKNGSLVPKIQAVRFTAMLLVLVMTQSLYGRELVELRPHYRTVTLTGFTYPRQELTVSSEVSGRCETVYADVGDVIPDNGVLAEIDTTFIKLDIAANKVNQERARRQLAQEEKTLARFTRLRRQESAPQAQLDEAELAADLNRLEIRKLQNQERRLEEKLVRHTITVPPGWHLIERFIEPGELVQEGKSVARLGDFKQLLVPLAVSYGELLAIENSGNLQVDLPELGLTLPATIYRTSPVFDATTRKIQIELLIDAQRPLPDTNRQEGIRGGMRAQISFTSREESNSFAIPSSALINRYEAQWLLEPDGATTQVILIGMEDDGATAIVSGEKLKAGQQYLADPRQENAGQR